jgi:hypothetical protein
MAREPPPHDARAALEAALEQEETRVRRLEEERAEAAARVARIRAELGAREQDPIVRSGQSTANPTPPRSPAEKVKLFRALFRGRDDLYPTRFVSKKTGKPGYAPVLEQIRPRSLRAAEGEVRGLHEPSIPAGG